jgi:lipoprotein-anchoring transpeptidase ErfK/SrfK
MNLGFVPVPTGALWSTTKGVGALRMSTRAVFAIAALGGLALLTGCGAANGANWQAAGTAPGQKTPPAAAITAPASGATDVSTATELSLSGTDPKSTVTLTDAAGTAVPGALRADGSTWVPGAQLKWNTAYTASVATPGRSEGKKVTFTTMSKPDNLVRVSTPLEDDAVYGVAMPLVVRFEEAVPKDQRAAVEKRLFVTSTPAQRGAWNWFDGTEVHFRPAEYWQEGTKLSVRIATGGLPLGGHAYGGSDVTVQASIGDKVLMVTDNNTKTMTVTRHDQVVRTIPVSLGKASKPSSSGNMVVMTKAQSELFVGTDPGDEYRTTVYWTQRLTIGGEYIHAAPWSEGDQGHNNVSHGCTNVSTENAKWLFGITHVGDPVIVKNTGSPLEWGNGYTDWDRSFDDYVKGSALPPPPAASPAPSTAPSAATPSPSAS